MESLKMLIFVIVVWGCLLSTVLCQICQFESALSGVIEHSANGYENKCWTIIVPRDNFIVLTLRSFSSYYSNDNMTMK
ncbi:hypothetical protein NPIL_192171 [Nephila pilipes]|uniref:Salivary secreted peptide n=1 Tax=Nephila pilipes TaxID=299642 RepID=A0A8X6NH75_NEPPI|nr:hypothetical protein NPIL_192171 [Nephila pilipes]